VLGKRLRAAQVLRRLTACAVLLGACIGANVRADAPVPANFPSTGAHVAVPVATRQNVAVIELTGDYSRNLPGGAFNVEPRTQVSKAFYKGYADQYDFLVVFSNFEFNTGDAKAFYVGVRNDTRGLGRPIFDNSSRATSTWRHSAAITSSPATLALRR
jgi:hypothetical protein